MRSNMSEDAYLFVKNTLMDNFLKLARVNVMTGAYEFLKYDELVREEGYDDIPSIYEYIKKQVADGLVSSEYVSDYLNYGDPEYVRKRIFERGDRRMLQSYKRRIQAGYIWVTFGIAIPKDVTPENPWALFYWQKADTNTTIMVDALSTLSSIYYKILKINLTRDTFQVIKTEPAERKLFSDRLEKISDWWRKFEEDGFVYPEDLEVYRNFADIEQQKQYFREKRGVMQSCHYRRKIADSWRWVQMELIPSIEYTDDDQVLILYVKDVHDEYLKEKRSREAMLDEYHRDALTRLYNRHKYNEDIEQLSEGSGSTRLTACYVDVNGLHEVNNKLGHERGDDMLCSVADVLKKYFPEESVYRIGGDEFVMLSCRLSSQSVENIMEKVREVLLKDNYEISVGVASGEKELAIHKIVGEAELAMRADKERYYRQNGGRRERRALNEELEKTLARKKNTDRFLNLIAHRFNGVYFVNLKQDKQQYIYIPDYFLELIEKADDSYSRAMQLYLEKYVKWEYYEAFREVLDYGRLAEKLRRDKVVSLSYQKVDGSWMYLRIIAQNEQSDDCEDTIWIFSGEQME